MRCSRRLAAAKKARDFLNRAGSQFGATADEIRKHMEDVEGLLRAAISRHELEVRTLGNNWGYSFWGKHLEQTLGVAKPTTPLPNGYKWHAHHILFKEGLKGNQQLLVKEGQEILRQVGIDPLFGKEVFVWAPNNPPGQHDIVALQPLVDALRKSPKGPDGKPVYKAIVAILEKFGREAAKRGI